MLVDEDKPSCCAVRSEALTESSGKQMMDKGTGTVYRIVVRSELSERYAVAFEGMEMETKHGNTVLTAALIRVDPVANSRRGRRSWPHLQA